VAAITNRGEVAALSRAADMYCICDSLASQLTTTIMRLPLGNQTRLDTGLRCHDSAIQRMELWS
jgi:hypothetical protein